jgi:hypothetical protein
MVRRAGNSSKRDSDLWFLADKGEAHKLAFPWLSHCRKTLGTYYTDVLYYMQLYAGTQDLTGTGYTIAASGQYSKLKFGLTSTVVDTAQSIVGAARTLPQVLSRGGNWSTQRKAKLTTAVLQSQFQDLGLFNLGTQAIVDGCVGRIGALSFFVDPETDKPGVERVLPLELGFDPVEANSGDIRTLGRDKLVNRDVAKALWPKFEEALTTAKGPGLTDIAGYTFMRDSQADQILIREMWRLPSKKGAKDGRHIIFTDNCTLVDEKWTRPRFPIAFYRWAPLQVGFLGKSLVAECEPAQRRVEQNINYIEKCQDLGSKPMVWLEKGAQVEAEQIDNLPMSVGRYAGTAPIFSTFDATPHDIEASNAEILQRILTQLGLSTTQITGDKPSGVTSAVALKTVEDISSRRHVINIRQVEQFYLQCAQCLMDVNDELAEKGDYSIDRKVRSRFLESTKWSEARIKDEDCKLSVYPISSLPPTPAGQLDQITDWINTGVIPPDAGMMLLGMPDTQAFADTETADRTFIEFQAEKMLDGKRVVPDPHCNLSLAADLIRRHYLNAKMEGAPEKTLENFKWYLQNCQATIAKATAAQAPAPPPATNPSLAPVAEAALPPGAGPLPMG